jgi:hypothetical protein
VTKKTSYKSANAAAKKRLADAHGKLDKLAKKSAKKRSFPTKAAVVKAKKKVVPSMFHAMLGIFDMAGVKYRTWALKTTPGLQEYDGHYIIVGSDGSSREPYTGFCFDTTGFLREVTCVSTSEDQQVAVECIGKQTTTVITPFREGKESRHVTNPEEN